MSASTCSVSQVLAAESPGLNWVRLAGAEECLSSTQLAAAVNARVGASVFEAPDQAQLLIEGHVRRAGDDWAVTLDVVDAVGTRIGQRRLVFAGESCHVIDESVTLVVAVTLYPNTQLLHADTGPKAETLASFDQLFANEPSELDPAKLQQVALTPTTPVIERDDTVATLRNKAAHAHGVPVALTLGALMGSGQLPGLNIAGALYGWLQLESLWPIEVAASLFNATTLPIDSSTTTRTPRVRYNGWSTELRVCPLQLPWMSQLHLCGGGALGSVRSLPSELGASTRAAQDLIANVHAALLWRWWLAKSLHLRAAWVVAVPLIRRAYTYLDDQGRDQQLFRAAPVTGQLELGVGVSFN